MRTRDRLVMVLIFSFLVFTTKDTKDTKEITPCQEGSFASFAPLRENSSLTEFFRVIQSGILGAFR